MSKFLAARLATAHDTSLCCDTHFDKRCPVRYVMTDSSKSIILFVFLFYYLTLCNLCKLDVHESVHRGIIMCIVV